jgi:hypothetical protein
MTEIEVAEGFVRAEGREPEQAARALIEDALDDSDVNEPDFAFLFCSPAFTLDRFIPAVDEALGSGVEWVGCTTAGEISSRGPSDDSAVILIIQSDGMQFNTGVGRKTYDEPVQAGKTAAEGAWTSSLSESENDTLLFSVMAGETLVNMGTEFGVVKGIYRHVPAGTRLVGGSAGDKLRGETTYQFCNGEIYDDAVVITAMESDLPIVTGQEHGFKEKVASGMVTAVDGRVVKEINGEPAARFYADAVGVDLAELQKLYDFPLSSKIIQAARYLKYTVEGKDPLKIQRIFNYAMEYTMAEEMGSGRMRIVTPIQVTDDDGVLLTTTVRENQPIHIVTGKTEDIIAAGKDAFSGLSEDHDTAFAIVTDCVSRHRTLEPDEKDEEVKKLNGFLQCPLAGFYSYGEIGGLETDLYTFSSQTVSGFAVRRD